MNPQLSQDYNVDSRYRGLSQAKDNSAGRQFLAAFLRQRREKPSLASELLQEDRFFMAGPGDSQYTFRNSFTASK